MTFGIPLRKPPNHRSCGLPHRHGLARCPLCHLHGPTRRRSHFGVIQPVVFWERDARRTPFLPCIVMFFWQFLFCCFLDCTLFLKKCSLYRYSVWVQDIISFPVYFKLVIYCRMAGTKLKMLLHFRFWHWVIWLICLQCSDASSRMLEWFAALQ